jgi:hypothetical protein
MKVLLLVVVLNAVTLAYAIDPAAPSPGAPATPEIADPASPPPEATSPATSSPNASEAAASPKPKGHMQKVTPTGSHISQYVWVSDDDSAAAAQGIPPGADLRSATVNLLH